MEVNTNEAFLYIQILNKNLKQVNGFNFPKAYAIREGAVFTKNFNEELDSATVVVPFCESEIEIEAFDKVYIGGKKINERSMLVDSYTCTQTCLNPPMYSYEIQLMSQTKLLEGMQCPSLSITRIDNNPRSVWYYLNQYLNEYCHKVYTNSNGGDAELELFFNPQVQDYFDNIECPEMQWNEPNLREVITDLMLVADKIPYVESREIFMMDLTQQQRDISLYDDITKNINYITSNQSSADYVSELKSTMQNAIGENMICNICQDITFRNYETYMLTTENVKVETDYPIYNLKSIAMKCKCSIRLAIENLDNNTTVHATVNDLEIPVDIANNILEYGEWLTKDVYYAGMNTNTQPSTNYQNTCLYWKRGAKGIHNFEAKVQEKILWINNQKSVLELLLNQAINSTTAGMSAVAKFKQDHPEYDDPKYDIYPDGTRTYDWKSCMFRLWYETLSSHVLLASKGDIPSNKRVVVDNQANSYVNAKSYGILEYAKANRLGNKIKCINGRFGVMATTPSVTLWKESDIPEISDTYGDYIIFKKEISVYKDYIRTNYWATENYVLRNYFTGVKSKSRTWKILDGSEAFVRADIIKFYINPNTMSSVNSVDSGYKIPVYSTLQEYANKLNYLTIKFKESKGVATDYYPKGSEILYKGTNYLGMAGAYMLPIQKIISGNSLLITFRCYDNAIVGKYVDDNNHDIGSGVKAMTQKNCRYVNDDGENYGGWIYIHETFNLDNCTDAQKEAFTNLYPAVNTTPNGMGDYLVRIPFNFHKDNKEITQITIQFELNTNATNMFIGK